MGLWTWVHNLACAKHLDGVVVGLGPDWFFRRHLLRSTEDPDEGISVSIWDSMEDLLEYERGEFRQSLAKEVEHLYRGEYWVKHFEVTA